MCLLLQTSADGHDAYASVEAVARVVDEKAVLPAVVDENRLDVLRSTGLLDTPPEEAFDRITRLAQRLLGVDAVLVSLVDDDRQFFKSHRGLAPKWAQAGETALSHSFCQYVVATRQPLVVRDAREDQLLGRNGAIDGLGVVGYAGIPLEVRGEVLGTLCVIENEPREWAEWELDILTDLAAFATMEAERRYESRRLGLAHETTGELAQAIDALAAAVRAFGTCATDAQERRLERLAMLARSRLDDVEKLAARAQHAVAPPEGAAAPHVPVDLGAQVRRAAAVAATIGGSEAISIDTSGDETLSVECDPHGLDQAVSAVFVTFLHHLAPGGTIEAVVRPDGSRATLTVTCAQQRLPVADLAALVARFGAETCTSSGDTPAESRIRAAGGAMIVENGRVRATTASDGTTLVVSLPTSPADKA